MTGLLQALGRVLLSWGLASCCALPVAAQWYEATQPIMGTRVHAEVWSLDEADARRALADVMAEMHRINALMSPYIDTSELSLINANAARMPVSTSRELMELLARSARLSELTDGAFDVTFASIGRRYDYRAGAKPDEDEISAALPAIDYRHVLLDWQAMTVAFARAGVSIDLGGIAKGHAVDRAAAILRSRGFEHASVSAGGDSVIIGDRMGQPWTVGVRHPDDADRMSAILPLEDTAVSTSGDYERYFDENGVRYHHILDPDTGDSARAIRSVTILGPDSTTTDGLSTSVFVLGLEDGLALINQLPGIDAIVIDGDGNLHYSDDLSSLGSQ
ncbi:MAG: FAD:protein FMN transferase [Pseudomonadaceae bacterium]|nr:FAD:protein FMN transferase [Pseudomonadaceae bacterium]